MTVQVESNVGLNPMSIFVETLNVKHLPNFHRACIYELQKLGRYTRYIKTPTLNLLDSKINPSIRSFIHAFIPSSKDFSAV
jgi:hypothetical protein